MHKVILYIILPSFIILILSACKKKTDSLSGEIIWNSTEPLFVSLPEREKEFEKKNLILNPSFEEGRHLKKDSVRISFVLPGWEKVGENVYWTDTQNEPEKQSFEAHNGLHAIKIVRGHSSEADYQGEGIISDYIKVIKGKYELSFYARLEQVEPQISRLHNNLGDDVNIRIFFFDKNRVIISSSFINPANNVQADISFKGFSFSHNCYIKRLGWCKVLGKTANFPFSEGYLPENTVYVRIFLGFKGNGTIWFDSVNFNFSSENFSLYEKVKAILDNKGSSGPALIPSPKYISDYSFKELRTMVNERVLDPVILVPGNPGKEILEFAEKLSDHLGIVLKEPDKKAVPVRIIRKLERGAIIDNQLIFSLGKTQAYKENLDHLPFKNIMGKQQAYFINTVPAKNRLIILDAADNSGFDRAISTLIQLIRTEDRGYHHYDIIDYPDVQTRSCIFPLDPEIRMNLLQSRINKLADAGFNLIYLQEGENLTDYYLKNSAIAKRYISYASGIKSAMPRTEFGVSFLNMRFRKPMGSESISSSFKKQSENFIKLFKDYLKAGFNKILFTDEFIWDFLEMDMKLLSLDLLNRDDMDQFIYFTGFFLEDLQAVIKNYHGEKQIFYLPVISDNEKMFQSKGFSSIYFRELLRYKGIINGILWNGPSELPVKIDFPEAHYFQSGSGLINYLYINDPLSNKFNRFRGSIIFPDPEIARTVNIFNAFKIEMGGMPDELNLPSFYLADQNENSGISQVRMLTVADYLWNNKDYNSSESTLKALVSLYGWENAYKLIRFNDKYSELLHLCLLMEQKNMTDPFHYKTAEGIIIDLNSVWSEITKDLIMETQLLNDLSDIKNQVITRLYQIRKSGDILKQ